METFQLLQKLLIIYVYILLYQVVYSFIGIPGTLR